MTILERIVAYKHEEVRQRMSVESLEAVQARAAAAPSPRNLAAALRAQGGRCSPVALIAEVKRASPSKGLLSTNFDPVRLARTYLDNGASAVSVVTDEAFFQGSLNDLAAIRRAVGGAQDSAPLLRKDFIIHPYQVYEARAEGADAVLLIAAILPDEALAALLDMTHDLGMTALIEVHDGADLERVLPLSPQVVGVNNRNLHDFSVSLGTSLALRPRIPDTVCFVAESGIHGRTEVRRLAAAGVDAMLVGEALVTAPDVGAKVRELIDDRQS